MTTFTIIGAGMAGLLAAAILRDECDGIVEQQGSLPNNHSALLRFRSSIVGDTVNIPFNKVKVMKSSVPHTGNAVGDAVAYSLKTNGRAELRSSISAKSEIEERYIAPPDFIKQLAGKVTAPISFNSTYQPGTVEPVISTIPMPVMMMLLGWHDTPEFHSVPGFTIQARLRNCDVCGTIYFPGPESYYRASITNDLLIVEFASPNADMESVNRTVTNMVRHPKEIADVVADVLKHFGMPGRSAVAVPEVKASRYAKIQPINDNVRKRFILWASEKHNVYSLGRFATWRPGLLLDDVVNDVRVIQKIARTNSYEGRK